MEEEMKEEDEAQVSCSGGGRSVEGLEVRGLGFGGDRLYLESIGIKLVIHTFEHFDKFLNFYWIVLKAPFVSMENIFR